MYWTAGSCNRDFDCTFKHTKGSAAPAGPEATTGNTSKRDADDNPDFFSVEGLAMSSGASSVDHHTLTPVEAHNHMKQFTRNNYHFDKAQHVQGFVRILASINDRNKAWVCHNPMWRNSEILIISSIELQRSSGQLRNDIWHFFNAYSIFYSLSWTRS